LPLPAALASIAALLGPLSPLLALILTFVLFLFFYLDAYAMATISIAPSPPAGTGGGFLVSGTSSHEVGHTLNASAFGGVVLWINAIDENIPPFRKLNLAYGELTAEGHAQNMPTPPPLRPAFFVSLWV